MNLKFNLYQLIFFFLTIVVSGQAQDGLHLRNINLPCIEKNFNVYVHLSVDSTTRQPFLGTKDVDRLMEDVSEFFEPICASFTACEINVIENYTFHEVVDTQRLLELEILFGKPRRLNVYILGTIPNASCGTSTYYGIHKEAGESIFLETAQCADGLAGQLAHHLGHYFGLTDTYHGNDIELVDDPNCAVVSDSICDTPADPFGIFLDIPGLYRDVLPDAVFLNERVTREFFVRNCEFILEHLDPVGEFYQPQVGNIMSAYPCRCGFTNGQFLKMVDNYNSATNKPY